MIVQQNQLLVSTDCHLACEAAVITTLQLVVVYVQIVQVLMCLLHRLFWNAIDCIF